MALIYLEHGERETLRWSVGELERHARHLALRLVDAGLTARPVLLVHARAPDFILALCACLFAGAVAVPCADPALPRNAARAMAIAQAVGPAAILGLEAQRGAVAKVVDGFATLPFLATDKANATGEDAPDLPAPAPAATAFLQFTSGSTRTPRGVSVSHANLAANLGMIRQAFAMDRHAADVSVSWLPHYHDMGLIGGLLAPLAFGTPAVLLPPLAFVQRPERWLAAMSRYGGSISGGPDFAYALCAARVRPEQLAALDLSRWRLAFCGAERVREPTLNRFAEVMAPAKFRPSSLFPCYGLAEASLLVSGGPAGEGPRIMARTAGSSGGAGAVVDSGMVCQGQVVEIVEPGTSTPMPAGEVGEIWVSGPNVAMGYWADEVASAVSFGGELAAHPGRRFLRTGDLGLLRQGRLAVLGRLKHVIILHGAKHHAEDIEATVAASHPKLGQGGGAAFAVDEEVSEGLVILHEVARVGRGEALLVQVAAAALAQVTAQHGLRPREIHLLAPWTLPRTSSGKVRREACRAAWTGGAPTGALFSWYSTATPRAKR